MKKLSIWLAVGLSCILLFQPPQLSSALPIKMASVDSLQTLVAIQRSKFTAIGDDILQKLTVTKKVIVETKKIIKQKLK